MYFHKRHLGYSWKKQKKLVAWEGNLSLNEVYFRDPLCLWLITPRHNWNKSNTIYSRNRKSADSIFNYLWSGALIPIIIDIIAAVQIRVNRIVVTSNITYVSGGYLVEIVRMSKPYRQHP